MKNIKIQDKNKNEDKMQSTVPQIIAPEIQKSVGAQDSLNNTKIQKDLDTNMMNIDPPTDSKLENILMDLVKDIKHAVEIKKQHNPAPSYMGSGSQQARRCPGGRHRRRGSADTVDVATPEGA